MGGMAHGQHQHDTSCARLMASEVEDMVTRVAASLCPGSARCLQVHRAVPCGRGGSGSGAEHWAVCLCRASVLILSQQAKHWGLVWSCTSMGMEVVWCSGLVRDSSGVYAETPIPVSFLQCQVRISI